MPKTRPTLITGAAGFIGSHLVDDALKRGPVVAIDNLSGGYRDNLPRQKKDFVFYKEDCVEIDRMMWIVKKHRPATILHFAAYAAEGLSPMIRAYNYTNNIVGSASMISSALQYVPDCNFIYASSAAVYGFASSPHHERQVELPMDPYGIAKLAVEKDLLLALGSGLRSAAVRLHNVYGPRQNLYDKYRNVVGIFMRTCLADEEMPIIGNGQQSRCFTYIDDVVAGIEAVRARMHHPSFTHDIYNIGSDKSTTIEDLAELVAKACAKPQRVRYHPKRTEAAHVVCDHSKIKKDCFWSANVPLEYGLAHMAEWARTAKQRQWRKPCRIEVPRLLPEAWK